MTNRYELHHSTLFQGWVSFWNTESDKGKVIPYTYKTIKAAQAEINDFFKDIEDEINSGEREPDEGYDREEFRIYDNINKEYVG